jgi:hypothetical protein
MEPDRDDDALLVAAADDPDAFGAFYHADVAVFLGTDRVP